MENKNKYYRLVAWSPSSSYYCPDDDEKVVAYFTTREKAEAYVANSLLKNPTWGKKFGSKSLLYGYRYYKIEEPECDEPPINPEI